MSRTIALLTIISAFAVGALAADSKARPRRAAIQDGDTVTIYLNQGSDLAGTYRGRKNGQIWLEFPNGEIFIEPSTVAKIKRISVNEADYLSRKASINENDAAAHWSLSQWARHKGMKAEAIAEAEAVIAIMPEHKEAAMFLENPQWILQPASHINRNRSPTAPVAAPPAEPKSSEKNAWRVSGAVYSLVTLKPEPGATITFRRDLRESATVTTDKQGAYEIDLPKKDGWTVSLEANCFRPGQILDIEPSYRLRDEAERRFIIEHTSDGDLDPLQVDWKRTDSKVRMDLIAVPDGWMTVHDVVCNGARGRGVRF